MSGFLTALSDVTILILIDGFLQYLININNSQLIECHNPYFNRWFSAILDIVSKTLKNAVTILILIDGFLQYAICR